MSASGVQQTNDRATIWSPGQHISALDGVRGLAILLVTLYRFRPVPNSSQVSDSLQGSLSSPVYQWFDKVLAYGEHGVELFFVLSGFLITGILIDARGKPGIDFFSNFFARRALRILPLYFFTLLVLLVIAPMFFEMGAAFDQARQRQIYLWFYLSNWCMSGEDAWCFGALDHFWSLAIEEHFYFVWPFVVYFCSPSKLLRVCILGALASASLRLAFVANTNAQVAPEVFTAFRCEGLLLGSALAVWMRQPRDHLFWRPFVSFSCCAVLGMVIVLGLMHRRLLTIDATLWPTAWAMLLMLIITSSPRSVVARLLEMSWLRHLGRYSYAIYVFQSPILYLLTPWLVVIRVSFGDAAIAYELARVAVLFSVTLGLAWVSWYALESRCLRCKEWLPGRIIALVSSVNWSHEPRSKVRFGVSTCAPSESASGMGYALTKRLKMAFRSDD